MSYEDAHAMADRPDGPVLVPRLARVYRAVGRGRNGNRANRNGDPMKSPFTNPMLGMGTFPPSGPPVTTTPLPTCREDRDPGDEQPPEPNREEFREKALRRAREMQEKAAQMHANLRDVLDGWKAGNPSEATGRAFSNSGMTSHDAMKERERRERARREYEARAALSKAYQDGMAARFTPKPMSEILRESREFDDFQASYFNGWTKFYTR